MSDAKQAYSSLAEEMISKFGELERLSFLSEFPDFEFLLHFPNKTIYSGARRGKHDLNFLSFGYGGEGPRCLRYFLEGVGVPVSAAEIESLRSGAILTLADGTFTKSLSADSTHADGANTLHGAVAANDEKRIVELLRQEVDINVVDTDGATPLHHAALSSTIPVTEALLNGTADVAAVTNLDSHTALHMAARRADDPSNRELLELMISHGADPYTLNCLNETALHTAALYLNEVAVRFFVQHGLSPDLNSVDFKWPVEPLGYVGPPMDSAILRRSTAMMRLLIELGASTEVPIPKTEGEFRPPSFGSLIESDFWPNLRTDNEMSFELRAELYAILGNEPPS